MGSFFSNGPVHLKLSVSGGTMTAAMSLNGGKNFIPLTTQSGIGTISKGGFFIACAGCGADLYSVVVN
jgi:hypothetical protein